MFEGFFGVKRKVHYHSFDDFDTSLKVSPIDPKNEIQNKKDQIIKNVDEIINDTFSKIRFQNDNSRFQSISPRIISPSETGETELELMENKIKELELELKNIEDKNDKGLDISYKTIQLEVEIPRYIIKAKENLDFNSRMMDINNRHPIIFSESDHLHVESLNKIDNFLNIKLRGYEEIKSKRRFSDEKNVCIMTFVENLENNDVSYYADNKELKRTEMGSYYH